MLHDLGKPLTLPETVVAVMTDGSKQSVPVTWDTTEDTLADISGQEGKHTVMGTADGLEAKAFVTVSPFNYLKNSSFETGDLSGWTLTDLANADQLYVENKASDSLSGSWHMHFWSAKADSVEFTLEQEAPELESGTYKYSISIMGGDAGEQEIYAYVKINGAVVFKKNVKITSYGQWDTAQIDGIEITENDKICFGIYVKCAGSGNGAWGKIDDAVLNLSNR